VTPLLVVNRRIEPKVSSFTEDNYIDGRWLATDIMAVGVGKSADRELDGSGRLME